jgi:thiol-disulfide isomerase/thioredoxin
MEEIAPTPLRTEISGRRPIFYSLGGLALLALRGWFLWLRLSPAPPSAPISSIPAPEVGHPAPDFSLPTLDGAEIRLADLRGRPVILNFWATWCPPCRREMPALEIVWQQYNRGDVMVLGVDQGESVSLVSEYVRQNVGRVSVTNYSPPWTEPKWWGKNTRNRLKSAQNGAETVCFALKSPQYGAIFKPLRMSSQVANNS